MTHGAMLRGFYSTSGNDIIASLWLCPSEGVCDSFAMYNVSFCCQNSWMCNPQPLYYTLYNSLQPGTRFQCKAYCWVRLLYYSTPACLEVLTIMLLWSWFQSVSFFNWSIHLPPTSSLCIFWHYNCYLTSLCFAGTLLEGLTLLLLEGRPQRPAWWMGV